MDYRVPELGEGLYEAELVSWYVQPGDQVRPGQNLAEVVTDKATMDLPAPFTGTIDRLAVPAGQVIQVGDLLLCYSPAGSEPPAARERMAVTGDQVSADKLEGAERAVSPSSPPRETGKRPSSPPAADGPNGGRRLRAAPAVRRMANALNVDLEHVKGSGPDGRVLISDLAAAAGNRRPPASRSARSNPMLELGTAGTRVPMRGLRRQIAERMLLSSRTIPHYTYVDECNVTRMLQLLGELKRPLLRRHIRLSNLAFFVKAVVAALRQVPLVNATLEEETAEVILHDHYHIGVATSTSRGLVVPVIHDADQLDLPDVAGRIDQLTRAARDGRLTRDQLQGSTFTISSVGTIGGMVTTPIINHPEVAIMGVGKTFKRPVYDEQGQIVPANMVYLSFSFDHRVVDGSIGATFGNSVIQHLQNPATLLLDQP